MKLLDVRRFTVEQGARVRFDAGAGQECTIDEHGIARVPSLRTAPGFDIESGFASAAEFVLERAPRGKSPKEPADLRRISRSELEQLCERKEPAAHVAAGQDHDE